MSLQNITLNSNAFGCILDYVCDPTRRKVGSVRPLILWEPCSASRSEHCQVWLWLLLLSAGSRILASPSSRPTSPVKWHCQIMRLAECRWCRLAMSETGMQQSIRYLVAFLGGQRCTMRCVYLVAARFEATYSV